MTNLNIVKRFVLPFGVSYPGDSNGLLLISDWMAGPHPISIDELGRDRCFVLLGDVGVGKSTELSTLYEKEKNAAPTGGSAFIYLNLSLRH